MTSGEFLRWCAYLEHDRNSFRREDYYLAQIASEIRMGNAKNPDRVRLEDFLIKFSCRPTEKRALTEEEKSARLARTKAMWCGLAGAKY